MIDVHCHLTDPRLQGLGIQRIVEDARRAGVTAIITNGTSLEDSLKAIQLAEKYPEVWATVGIHPEEIFNFQFSIFNELSKLVKHKKVVGIGEIGLDYRQGITDEEKEKQRELFKMQLELATEAELPAVVHNRNADEDIYSILKAVNSRTKGILMHCFTRNLEFMDRMSNLGAYLSFGGMITYKNNSRMRNAAKLVPENKLLLETDSPYSLPDGEKGNVNTPLNVKIVAERIAQIKGVSVREIEDQTSENAKKLFKLI